METLNKNWFAITLIAVVFFLLGFLMGKQSPNHNKMHQIKFDKKMNHIIGEKGDGEFLFISEGGNIDMDTLIHNSHKKIELIIKKEKVIKKKD